MSGENGDSVVFAVPAPVNGDRTLVNGLSNGHHSSSSSSKHRSSSSHHKSSSKDKHRSSSSSSKGHHSSSSSSSKDKPSSSSSSSKDNPGGGGSSSSSTSAHKSSSGSGSSSRDKDKDRHRDKHVSTSSSGRSDKHKSSSSSNSANKPSDHKSSSSSSSSKAHKSSSGSGSSSRDKDKDKHRSSASTSSSSRDKDKDRHHKSSSSSSATKHKHSSSSSSSSKHRSSDKDKNHHHHSSSKSHSSSSISSKLLATGDNASGGGDAMAIATEAARPVVNAVRDDSNDGCVEVDADDPLAIKKEPTMFETSQASSCDYSMSQFRSDETDFVAKAEPRQPSDEDEEEENNDDNDDDTNGPANASVKHELDDDDDEEGAPIAKRFKVVKNESPADSDDEEDAPIVAKKIKTEKPKKAKKKKYQSEEDDDDYEDAPIVKKPKKEKKEKKTIVIAAPVKRESLNNTKSPQKSGGRKKKEEEPEEVWKWWEEEKRDDGIKWNFLEHRGPVFAPPYEPLPDNVHFEYDGRVMKLSQDAEEIACFYAKMLNHDFTSKPVFNANFFEDWRKAMTSKERERITKLKNCNFQRMFEHFQAVSERNKSRTKEEKAALKAENEQLMVEYGFCTIDGHKEKIGNFRIEPPGLFRGRGEHPKMGKVKRRVMPEDIMINCARGSQVPVPPSGHRWREVKHDNAVTWLASWTENVQGQVKYVMLNPGSKLKGEKDWQKYELARRLHKHIDRIRNAYKEEWKSKEMRIRQRGVALYFIDKLALRAGNEKDEDQADTVGCCSLRVEHIQLHRQMADKENVVVFDFLGKDSIRYYNEVEVEKRVFKNLELFKENKKEGDDLFDRLNTVVMNEHLRELMDGLTAKVFRTYNASWTLQCQLNEMTDGNASLPEKLLAYNRANRAVAVLCNHQRAVPKSHEKSMENLKEKIRAKRDQVSELEVEVKHAVKDAKHGSVKEQVNADKKKKQLQRAQEQLKKMELQETDRDENKTIALGTSKLNYLDPRISVAWCKKYDVPIDKIYNKTQRDKFRWAIDMATEDYQF